MNLDLQWPPGKNDCPYMCMYMYAYIHVRNNCTCTCIIHVAHLPMTSLCCQGNWAVPPHSQELIASVAATSTTPQTTPTHKIKHSDIEISLRGKSEDRFTDTTDDMEVNDSYLYQVG